MASEDVVCRELEWTMAEFEKLRGEKEVWVLQGEHLEMYFAEGYRRSVGAMVGWLGRVVGRGK